MRLPRLLQPLHHPGGDVSVEGIAITLHQSLPKTGTNRGADSFIQNMLLDIRALE